MGIKNRKDKVMLECDNGGEESTPFPREEFLDMIEEAKNDGWTITKGLSRDSNTTVYRHQCADCSE